MLSETWIRQLNEVLEHMPESWLRCTTHRLDIYDESRAKSAFLDALNELFLTDKVTKDNLDQLPTAYDYVRLGHELSSILEWVIGDSYSVNPDQVICFASRIMPLMAILRFSSLQKGSTKIYYEAAEDGSKSNLPFEALDLNLLAEIYCYQGSITRITKAEDIPPHEKDLVVLITSRGFKGRGFVESHVDVVIDVHSDLGAAIVILNSVKNQAYGLSNLVGEVQHVRRRESIAITPTDAYNALSEFINHVPSQIKLDVTDVKSIETEVMRLSKSPLKPVLASSGLSVQYAIFMGFIEKVRTEFPSKQIKFLIPPNCYGGTNDQARRIAACDEGIQIIDMPVDKDRNIITTLDQALDEIALAGAIGIVLAEIPTNPRVEVPDLDHLGVVLRKNRLTAEGAAADLPVFTVDQTFCPNVPLLGCESPLNGVQVISYVSCSKFPSAGECTGGYAAGNIEAEKLMGLIFKHLELCDNQPTAEQYMIMARNFPTMETRIEKAHKNALDFVSHIKKVCPASKLNFVTEEFSSKGFLPSVFSLELDAAGDNDDEIEVNRRQMNLDLIRYMITHCPSECKHCVSYGQIQGSYWTVPATSTQGTTKEKDKDYIIRVSIGAEIDLDALKVCFTAFFNK